ncbi:MAG TPA: hypothetical protein VML94_03405 [Thermoplasmata archaeon]|nr:hypothetical protein [Thermoplasmata archaeon]
MPAEPVREWLLDDAQPSIRYRTLVELDGRPESDPEVRDAQRLIPKRGWAADLLAERSPEGWWVSGESFYRPKYTATDWKLLALSELGLSRRVPAIRESCEYWMTATAAKNGGVGASSSGNPHHCVAGNMARALIRFGYGEDPRVHRTLEWIAESADPKGGWSCFGSGRTLDSWEGLSALAACPPSQRSASMQRAVELGAEFFLDRELDRQGARYAPWYRFHFPVHYYYDVLVGLEILLALGYADDPRLKGAIALVRSKRRSDGRWNLDAVHPDVEGAIARWFAGHPSQRPTPFALENVGAPSRMITFRALKVLAQVDGVS